MIRWRSVVHFACMCVTSFLVTHLGYGQSSFCDPLTPYFNVDLRGNDDSTWLSPSIRRNGVCCGIDPNENPPVRCVQFAITLDSGSVGIIFDNYFGAWPGGALDYSINCGIRGYPGELLCLDPPWPKILTFCEPGNNPNIYSIVAVPGPKITPPVVVSSTCTQTISVTGFQLNTIRWTSVPSDPVLESYLNCTSGCSTVVASYRPGAPDSVEYQATGIVVGSCGSKPVSLKSKVYFVNDKKAEILPRDPSICYGSATATLTAHGTGGRPPYRYKWSTGDTTQSINVKQGTYSVTISDNSSCPFASDTVTVIAYTQPTLAQAGPDQSLCRKQGPISISLAGQVQSAPGGRWTGGSGIFSPNDSSLNAIYTLSAAEVASGIVELSLSTTGLCTPHTDKMQIVLRPLPVAHGNGDTVCIGDVAKVKTIVLPNETYQWKLSDQLLASGPVYSFLASSPFQLKLVTTNEFGCSDSTIVPIHVYAKPIVHLFDTVACQGATLVVNGQPTANAFPEGKYTWYKDGALLPSVTSSILVTETGKYQVQYGLGQCVAKDSALYSFTIPTLQLSGDRILCRDAPALHAQATYTFADGVRWLNNLGTYTPNDTSLSVSYFYSPTEVQDGKLTLYAITTHQSPQCRPARDSLVVEYRNAIVVNPVADTLCQGSTTHLQLPFFPDVTYDWYRNGQKVATGLELKEVIFQTTTYKIISVSTLGCKDSANAQVLALQPAKLNLTATPPCIGEDAIIKAHLSIGASTTPLPGKYSWKYGSVPVGGSSDSLRASTSGLYHGYYSYSASCYAKDSLPLTFYPKPNVPSTEDRSFCKESAATITLDGGSYQKYAWNADTTLNTRNYTVNTAGTYKLEVFNQYNCKNIRYFKVDEICPPRLFVPTAFTPHGLHNQYFDVKWAYVGRYQLLIFNRWGEIIFESQDPHQSWDGVYKGEPMPIGVYPWVVTYEGLNQEFKGPYKKQGSVTLIR